MSLNPESGHGALLAITEDPGAAPTVFTTIGQLNSDIPLKLTHESTKITPHNERMSRSITSVVVDRDAINFEVNYLVGEATAMHDDLRDFFLANPPTTIGLRLTGPSGSASDVIHMSGEVINWELSHPVRSGVRLAKVSFQPSGPMRINGTLYS